MTILAAQVGSAAGTEHAAVIDTPDTDEAVVRRVLRGGHAKVRTVCGRHARAHARVWDSDSPRACGRCRTATEGGTSGRSPT